jgi:glycerol-3-phosphate dehydrogenase
MIRAGLFLYDHLARRTTLPASETIDLSRHPAGLPLRHLTNTAFIYSDVWAEDTRLVVLNALDAHERGARILTRTRCVRITPSASNWHATLRDDAGHEETVTARCVVNAAGPWASEFLERRAPSGARHAIRLVKGSHIVIPRLYTHPDAYLFQNSDRRVVFAIPYEHEFTLIGTTDVDYQGNPAQATISPEETQYLCDVATRHFKRTVTPADVIWSYSGVRPLLKDESIDATTVTRDYEFEWTDTGPPLLSVFGGKLTTYRRLAEEALAEILSRLDRKASAWTARAVLPGGDLPGGDRTRFEDRLRQQYPHFKETLRQRWARTYGTRVEHWLGAATDTKRLGAEVLPDLFEAEIDYLRRIEWAKSATDILWRRTKLGLHLPPDATGRLDEWLRSHPLKPASISMT